MRRFVVFAGIALTALSVLAASASAEGPIGNVNFIPGGAGGGVLTQVVDLGPNRSFVLQYDGPVNVPSGGFTDATSPFGLAYPGGSVVRMDLNYDVISSGGTMYGRVVGPNAADYQISIGSQTFPGDAGFAVPPGDLVGQQLAINDPSDALGNRANVIHGNVGSTGGGGGGGRTGLVPCDRCTIEDLVRLGVNIFNWLLAIGGAAALLAVIVAGIRYLIAVLQGADSSAIQAAKQSLTYAITGLVVLLTAVVIVRTVTATLGLSREGLPPEAGEVGDILP